MPVYEDNAAYPWPEDDKRQALAMIEDGTPGFEAEFVRQARQLCTKLGQPFIRERIDTIWDKDANGQTVLGRRYTCMSRNELRKLAESN